MFTKLIGWRAVALGGSWRATEADEVLRRTFSSPDEDDGHWAAVEVPGHGRDFTDGDGPMLYRRRFESPRPEEGRRSWLTLDGVFYQGDVWLDGSYVGDTEGYFFPHTMEVTDQLQQQSEHLLAVEVTCSKPTDLTAKRNLTGVFQHWDLIDPDWNPGGIWRPVHLDETGPVRISRMRVLSGGATAEIAILEVRAGVDSAETGEGGGRVRVGDVVE